MFRVFEYYFNLGILMNRNINNLLDLWGIVLLTEKKKKCITKGLKWSNRL